MEGSRVFSVPATAGWQGHALSAAIIAVRAFQPGAEPMSQWSWWSWLLMLVPSVFPLVLWLALSAAWLLARAAAAVLERALAGRRR